MDVAVSEDAHADATTEEAPAVPDETDTAAEPVTTAFRRFGMGSNRRRVPDNARS
jgi:hypothetical protein